MSAFHLYMMRRRIKEARGRGGGRGLGADVIYLHGVQEGYRRGYTEGKAKALKRIGEMIRLFEEYLDLKKKYREAESREERIKIDKQMQEKERLLNNMGIAITPAGEILTDNYYDDEAIQAILRTLKLVRQMIEDESLTIDFFKKYRRVDDEEEY